MLAIDQIVQQLQEQRQQKQSELNRINQALDALFVFGKGKFGRSKRRKPQFSKAGLARIRAAQIARWKKFKAAQKKK